MQLHSELPHPLFFGSLEEAPSGVMQSPQVAALLKQEAIHDAYLLYIPAEVTLEEPIILSSGAPALTLLLVVEDRAEVDIVTQLQTDERISQLSHRTFVAAGAQAKLQYVSLQNVQAEEVDILQRGDLQTGAQVRWQNVTLGGDRLVHTLRSNLVGAGAQSSVDWMFYARGSEKHQLDCTNVFSAPQGGGTVTMKGVAQESASVRCRGMIDIGLQGRGTNTFLEEDVLMLDPAAKVDAIPALEIKTNDVKASHSATVSRVTEEDLYYFGARGIDPLLARRMYIEGFLSSLTQNIRHEAVREQISAAIDAKYASA